MFCLSNHENNLHINMYAKVDIHKRKLTQINTIKYDVKSYEVKMTILNFTYVQLKGLKILPTHRRDIWYSQNSCDANNKIINETPSLK